MTFNSETIAMGLHTSRVQNLGSGPSASPVDVATEPVESDTRFTFLGSDLNSSGYCAPKVLLRIGIPSSVFGILDNVWKQSRLSVQTKLRIGIYTSCVQSSLFHGVDTWTILKINGKRLHVTRLPLFKLIVTCPCSLRT